MITTATKALLQLKKFMMKTYRTFRQAFLGGSIGLSIVVTAGNVNALKLNHTQELIDSLESNGGNEVIGPHVAAIMDLPGEMDAKVALTSTRKVDSQNEEVHFLDLLIATSTVSGQVERKPYCFYLIHRAQSPRENVSQYYRVNLEGQLTKAIDIHSENKDGEVVKGSGKNFDRDVNSAAVKSAFGKEWALALKWARQHSKLDSAAKH